MNLTKMRELQWHDKLLKLFDAYVPNTPRGMTAQRLINIMLFYNPGNYFIKECINVSNV